MYNLIRLFLQLTYKRFLVCFELLDYQWHIQTCMPCVLSRARHCSCGIWRSNRNATWSHKSAKQCFNTKKRKAKAAKIKTLTPETIIPISMEVKDEKLVSRMREIIKSSDLITTTTKMIRISKRFNTSFMCF